MNESKKLWWKKKSILCVFIIFSKDNNKTANRVVQSKLGSLEIDEFFKITPNFDEKEARVTGKT